MAEIVGTAADETLVGTTGADVMDGGAGKDRLNGGDGDDIVNGGDGNDYVYGDRGNDQLYGGAGNDALVGDAGNDIIYGEDGNDGVYGGGGNDEIYGGTGTDTIFGDGGNDFIDGGADNDKLYGGAGDDRIFGGTGDDLLDGGAGNDTFIYKFGTGADTVAGNTGADTLELVLSSADLTLVTSDLELFADWLDAQYQAANGSVAVLSGNATTSSFTFGSLGLTVSAIEAINVIVDGQSVPLADLLNAAPDVAATQSVGGNEDQAIAGNVGAVDPDGDTITHAVSSGPAHGTVTLDAASGAFVYTPIADFSGADSFEVVVTDENGASAVQVVDVVVDAVADAPVLSGSDVAVTIGGVAMNGTGGSDVFYGTMGGELIDGGAGNDTIYADPQTPVSYLVELDLAAELTDIDGSEALTVVVSGVPAGATLSAGQELAPGSWQVAAADLDGLTMTVVDPVDVTLFVTATSAEANDSQASTSIEVAISFSGLDGTDLLRGGAGDDQIYGGAGIDLLDYSTTANGVSVYMYSGTAKGDGNDTFSNVEGAIGSAYGDVLYGSNNADIFYGGAGNDNIVTYAGNDVIYDGTGADTVSAGNGNDTIFAAADATNDSFVGGAGFDVVDYSAYTVALDIDLSKGSAKDAVSRDTLSGIESVVSGSGNDKIKGSAAADTLNGGAGDDVIEGGKGSDVLIGGAGNDTFVFDDKDVSTASYDRIVDFGAGDRLDFDDLLKGSAQQNYAQYVEVTDTAAGTMISVDMGTSQGFIDVVLLEGVHGIDLDDLMSAGQLVV